MRAEQLRQRGDLGPRARPEHPGPGDDDGFAAARAFGLNAYPFWVFVYDDGTLAAGELAFASDAATMHGGTVSVPAGAVRDVALRMRVLSDFSGSDNIDTACENIEFGQVEEYSVLVVAPLTPGAIPTSPVSSLLTVSKNVAQPDNLDFAWGASCGSNVFDYTLHEGTVGAWYSHTAAACTSAGLTSIMSFPPGAAGRYYLVTPTSVLEEGSYGQDSTATERPVSAPACLAPQNTNACP